MSHETEWNRRSFLGAGVAGAAVLVRPQRVLAANDRVRVAVCGVHGRGQDHLHNYAQIKNCEIAALCDIDQNVLRERTAELTKKGLAKPVAFTDVRKLLDDKSIDAISIATPNHWHSLMAIWACQAGKDVYVEKPCSHNLWEGQQLVKAAQKYNRVVQHGTQIRSATVVREMVRKMQTGLIGDPYMGRGLCYKWRDTIGRAPISEVPPGVDYDLWTGPAPKRPFTKNRFHYNWHWFWDFGNGDLGNQGVHQVDVVRWGMGVGLPNKVSAMGGHFMFDDDQQTPNDLNCSFEYASEKGKRQMITFEVRHWITNHEAEIGTQSLGSPERKKMPGAAKLGPMSGAHNTVGNIFYGSKGYLSTGDEDAATYKVWLGKDQDEQQPQHGGSELAHFQNFIDCVRSHNRADLNAPIEEGHLSVAMVHLANASYRLGRTIHFNPETQEVIGDDEAAKLLRDGDRGYRTGFQIPKSV